MKTRVMVKLNTV